MLDKKKYITLVPVGGLANRMRAIASAVELSRICGCRLNVYWFRDQGLNARFNEIFVSYENDEVKIIEESFMGKILYDRPRRHNLWLPLLPQKLIFSKCIYEDKVREYCNDLSSFKTYATKGKLYVASCYPLIEYGNSLLSSLFIPHETIRETVDSRISGMSDYRIGVHIRRTDNIVSISSSPDELFYSAIDEEIRRNPSVTIYLATDSDNVKTVFRSRYGDRLLTSGSAACRNSLAGISEAVAEMYTLSRMNKIYGSWGSTYSEVAAALGNIPIIMLRKDVV